MLPRSLLRYEVTGDSVFPSYLDERSTHIVRSILLQYEAFVGKTYRDLDHALEQLPDLDQEEHRLIAGLRRVIEEPMELLVEGPVKPVSIRRVVFELGRRDRDLDMMSVFRAAGEALGLPGDSLAGRLYGDLKTERTVRFPGALPSTTEVISRYNFRLLQGLMLQAERLRIELYDQARAVYRFAKLHGLLVELKQPGRDYALCLEITGPLSIFRHTAKYGYALARFLPACCAAGRYRLWARLFLKGRLGSLIVTQADRVLSSHRVPRLFDSKLESRFFRDYTRLESRWDISREAELLPTASGVFLPDFTFRLRARPSLRVDLEIIGFWTRDYLQRKRAISGCLSHRKLILCVDRKLCCDGQEPPFPCIPFTGHVPAEKVLEALDSFVN